MQTQLATQATLSDFTGHPIGEFYALSANSADSANSANLFLYESPHVHQEISAVDVAVGVHRHAFSQTGDASIRIRTRIGNERGDFAVARAADSDAALDAGIESVAGLRQRERAGVGAS